jgi:adenosylcobinamide-GDP ribazoletransferase
VLVAAGRAVELPPSEVERVNGLVTEPGDAGMFANLRGAVAFLTVFGLTGFGPSRVQPSPQALDWFPAVGCALGLGLGLFWRGATALMPALLAAALVVAADALATGGLHLDGLADTADGVLPPLPRARRLAVLRDPHTGAFGATALALLLVVRVAALAAFATGRPFLLGAVWCASRTAMAVTVQAVPYARREGLARAFTGSTRSGAVAVVGFGLASLVALLDGAPALAAVVATAAGSAAVQWLAVRRLRGFTGDTLGAAGVVGETLALVVAAAVIA